MKRRYQYWLNLLQYRGRKYDKATDKTGKAWGVQIQEARKRKKARCQEKEELHKSGMGKTFPVQKVGAYDVGRDKPRTCPIAHIIRTSSSIKATRKIAL